VGLGYQAEAQGDTGTQRGCHDITDGMGISVECWIYWVCQSKHLIPMDKMDC